MYIYYSAERNVKKMGSFFQIKMIVDTCCGNSTQIGRTVFHVLLMSETHAHAHTHARTHSCANRQSLILPSISSFCEEYFRCHLRFKIDIYLRGRFYDALETIAPRAIKRVVCRYCQNITGIPPRCPHYITSIILSLCCNAPVTAVKV